MPDALPTTISAWLGRCYAADLRRELGVVIPQFRTWIDADPANKEAAQSAFQADPQVVKRDHISRAYNSYISAALNGEPNG